LALLTPGEDFGNDGEGIGDDWRNWSEFGGLRGEKYFCEHLKSEYATVNEQG
jgi:hypothetical protein